MTGRAPRRAEWRDAEATPFPAGRRGIAQCPKVLVGDERLHALVAVVGGRQVGDDDIEGRCLATRV